MNGNIIINNSTYKYMFFDILTLIYLIKTKKKLISSFEESIKLLRKNNNFNIINIIKENILTHPFETRYFIIYKSNKIISTSRIIYKPKSKLSYISMVFTNEKYRGKKICYSNIKKLIKLTQNMFNIYELEVRPDNLPAIKCYENIGFKFTKTINYVKNDKDNIYNLMRLKL